MENTKVLVADDSTTMLRIIRNTLKSVGISEENIIEVTDGQKALTKCRECHPDIILTDWNMPVMNGLELVQNVRGLGITTPIIMITTEGRKNEVVIALKAGVNDYIVKPFTPDVLKEKLLGHIG